MSEAHEMSVAQQMCAAFNDPQYEILLNALTLAWIMGRDGIDHERTVPSVLLEYGEQFEAYWLTIVAGRGVDYVENFREWYKAQLIAERMEGS